MENERKLNHLLKSNLGQKWHMGSTWVGYLCTLEQPFTIEWQYWPNDLDYNPRSGNVTKDTRQAHFALLFTPSKIFYCTPNGPHSGTIRQDINTSSGAAGAGRAFAIGTYQVEEYDTKNPKIVLRFDKIGARFNEYFPGEYAIKFHCRINLTEMHGCDVNDIQRNDNPIEPCDDVPVKPHNDKIPVKPRG
jgi:hypothetical protein